MAKAPLIGISVGSIRHPTSGAPFLAMRPTYSHAVSLAGGAPVLIPFGIDPAHLRTLYERLDGLILSGGGDVEPRRYGKQKSLYTDNVNEARDEAETLLARWSTEDDKPLLAICRGHQVLNVALGGTLIQDIREERPGALRHDPPSDDWFPVLVHEVSVTPGSRLHTILGVDRLGVNSMHHQAIDQVAPGLEITACSDDGMIEGVERPQRRLIVGVQWHPEALVDRHELMRRLFEALVLAARE